MARKRTQKKTARVKNPSVKKYYGKFSPLLIIILVVVVAILGGVGYFLFGRGGMGGSSPLGSKGNSMMTQKAKESDFAYIDDELLRKHMAAQANAAKFKVVSKSSGYGGSTTMIYDMDGDTVKYRTTSSGEGLESDMIVIEDTTYIKDFKDGKWWKQTQKPGEVNDEIESKMEEYVANDAEEEEAEFVKTQYKNLGKEACGDLTCYKYEQLDPNDGTESAGRRLFWFDTDDYLLRKDLSEYGEFSSESEYSYKDVSVEKPSPTKDVPEGKNIYEYMMTGGSEVEGMPSEEELNKMMKQYESGSEEQSFPSADEYNFDSGDY